MRARDDGAILGQDSSYRRGLVLGFSMAETILLVLFVLLLAVGALIARHEERISWLTQGLSRDRTDIAAREAELVDLREALAEAKTRLAQAQSALAEAGRRLEHESEQGNRIQQLLTDLVRARQRAAELEASEAEARTALAQARDERDRAHAAAGDAGGQAAAAAASLAAARDLARQRDVELAQATQAAAAERDKGAALAARIAELEMRLSEQNAKAQALDAALAANPSIKSPSALAGAVAKATEADRIIGDLEGTIQGLTRELDRRSGGRGSDHLSCWYDAAGKVQYIFTATLTTHGIALKPTPPADRAQDFALLPTAGIPFGQALTGERFLAVTEGLYRYSQRRDPECRFFVRVVDRTGAGEKAAYKSRLRTVESRFYKLEVSGDGG
jgi:hypothetical protein